ncbi:KilA-N domain-containing protein [Magnetospirillum aberrantis]|uniref:KilA-N domain-containing protein n=1 Tax=Magnetospirillum aberrantis SpK TaxID=908842 RepID=A0A7C9UVZ0_9PROT|nr:KilA-N domain-containing protein [Magnetospirillum aberrantis]NFV80030.1 KilA-N domain-containing protein [Magnetospirillum aberrantis SpK]
MKKTITLIYNGTAIRDRGEMLNLTDMWKAAGADPSRQPAEWLRSADAERFIEFLAESLNMGNSQDGENQGLTKVTRGGNDPRTEAHWQIGMAYAKYLSPEFHMWCNSVVRAHMEGQTIAGVHAIKATLAKVQQWNTAYRMLGRINQIAGQRAAAQAMPAILAELGIHVDTSDSPVMRQGELLLKD